MKKWLFLIYCFMYLGLASAVPGVPKPVVDVHQTQEDYFAMLSYRSYVVTNALNNLGQVADIAGQIASVQSFQDALKVGGEICQLCSASDKQKLQNYVNQVNTDLCSQVGYAYKNITGIKKSIQSLQDVIGLLQTNPKEAGLALQNAAVQTQAAMQGTLYQVQILLAQHEQKQLAEQKLEKQNSEEIYTGIRNIGL